MKSTILGLSIVASAAQAMYRYGGDQFSGNLLGKLAKILVLYNTLIPALSLNAVLAS